MADKEWKQLDKFTKLMEMIMYLQYEPVFSKYCFYGCWCMPSGGADINRVWGQPVDEIDATCRDMQSGVKIIQQILLCQKTTIEPKLGYLMI